MFENILIPKYLAELPIVLIAAVCTAGLSLLLELCFKKGMIFGGWLPWVAEKYADAHLQEFCKSTGNMAAFCITADSKKKLEFDFAMENFFWFKPLGACVYCMHVWLSIFTAVFLIFVVGITWWWGLLFIPLAFFPLHIVKLLEERNED